MTQLTTTTTKTLKLCGQKKSSNYASSTWIWTCLHVILLRKYFLHKKDLECSWNVVCWHHTRLSKIKYYIIEQSLLYCLKLLECWSKSRGQYIFWSGVYSNNLLVLIQNPLHCKSLQTERDFWCLLPYWFFRKLHSTKRSIRTALLREIAVHQISVSIGNELNK